MSRSGTWSFATARGTVRVAPGELRIRRSIAQTVTESGRALADGRLPSALRDVGWAGIGAVTMLVPPAVEWLLRGGGARTTVGLIGLFTAVGGVATSVASERTATIPLRDVEHVDFDEGEIEIVHRSGDDDERETETVRPLNDEERSDAAVALRLRGVDLRGVKEDEAVSRTVVDAPKTELLA
ncbi:hypothetical protein ACFQMF_12875 [Halorubrum rutilum]|uniref:Uncharacterized protein n=1 Tax=Halorubrum rutilum TaxID=1364933 RepID=A0ABD6AN20_9EURY|nr:hypothetical protein [Halorubrum rutilum]